jgi:hypothetical protein
LFWLTTGAQPRAANQQLGPGRTELNLGTTSVSLVGCSRLLDAADVREQLGELRSSLEEIRLQCLGSFKRESRLTESV